MGKIKVDGWPGLEFDPGKYKEAEKRLGPGERGKLWESMEIGFHRIGRTRKEHLAWIIGIVQNSFRIDKGKAEINMTRGDLDNRKIEFRLFGLFPNLIDEGIFISADKLEMSDEEVKSILKKVRSIIERVLERREIEIDPFSCGGTLLWNDLRRAYYWEEMAEGWTAKVIKTTLDRILEYGHLIKKCPAPPPPPKDDKRGRECGNWFLANREDQVYCSARCQSRATTRAARAREKAKQLTKLRRRELLAEVRKVKKQMQSGKLVSKKKAKIRNKSK